MRVLRRFRCPFCDRHTVTAWGIKHHLSSNRCSRTNLPPRPSLAELLKGTEFEGHFDPSPSGSYEPPPKADPR